MARVVSHTSTFAVLKQHLHLAPTSGEAVHRQIARQIETLIHGQKLKTGQRLPAQRQLAQAMGVHPLTVARAYTKLQSRGLVSQQRGRGTFVEPFHGSHGRVAMILPPWEEMVAWPHNMAIHQEFQIGVQEVLQQASITFQALGLPYPIEDSAALDDWTHRLAARYQVVMTTIYTHEPLMARLADRGVHVVAYYRSMTDSRFSDVRFDRRQTLRQATAHLIKQGRRRIGYFARQQDDPLAPAGFRGYLDALEEAGLPYDPTLAVFCDDFLHRQSWREAVGPAVAAGRVGDAIVADVHHAGLQAIESLAAHGYRVPQDVAVVAFDDSRLAPETTPRATWMYMPRYEMGQAAGQIARDFILGQADRPVVRELAGELILGQSCGASATAMARHERMIASYSEAVPLVFA